MTMDVRNRTSVNTARLAQSFRLYMQPWGTWPVRVSVRYSRGADFSGSCRYDTARFTINIKQTQTYPYRMATHLARATCTRTHWVKPVVYVTLGDAYQLVLFVYLHELYHWLVYKAGRNLRQKESMADRFAARVLVDDYGATVRDEAGHRVSRGEWDFQDLNGFVAAARRRIGVEGVTRLSARDRSV